jgi:hypothetical protein
MRLVRTIGSAADNLKHASPRRRCRHCRSRDGARRRACRP